MEKQNKTVNIKIDEEFVDSRMPACAGMGKVIGLMTAMALTTMINIPAVAGLEKCTPENKAVKFQGTNGRDYCVSEIKMNWFSAFSWCKAIGGELATLDEACPGDWPGGKCNNIKGKQSVVTDSVWVADITPIDAAYRIVLSSGEINSRQPSSNYNSRTLNYKVLCK